MIAFRFLQLVIASAHLSALVKGQDLLPPFNDLEMELCDLPCANNGRCFAFDTDNDGVLDPQCFCNTTFQGDLCETPRTCSLACENGGTCNLGAAWWLTPQDDGSELELFKEIMYSCSFEDRDCKMFEERCECPSGTQGELCENKCEKTCLNDSECTFWGSEQRCRCTENFFGDQCENECTKGCQNGGLCLPDPNGSGGMEELCLCPAGFEGDLCEVELPCPFTCQNDGVCKFYDDRWFGEEDENHETLQSILERCADQDIPIAECLGAYGFESEPGAYCECPPGTAGSNCEISCDLDCQNGSTCEFYSREEQYCRCDAGFAGDLCEFQCSKNCGNSGICKADATSEWCQCSPFYEGEFCETERACDLSCQNGGNCVFLGGYREYNEKYFEECLLLNNPLCPEIEDVQQCECTNDFVGSDCDTPCPCQNGGTCSSRYYFRNRKLQVGEVENSNGQYAGNVNDQLVQDYDDFIFEPEVDPGYFCQCPFGYYGQDCEFKYDSENCELDCQNGGYCQADLGWHNDNQTSWEIDHDHGFAGEEVEANYNQNRGNGRQSNNDEPYNSHGGYNNNNFNGGGAFPAPAPTAQRPFEYCVCPGGFMGLSCEVEIDACDNQCKNGGVCTTSSSTSSATSSATVQGGNRALEAEEPGYATTEPPPRPSPTPKLPFGSCSCPDGYSGEFCERKACGSGYCSHGGTCTELPSGQTTSAGDDYVCDCSTSNLEDTVGIGRNCDAIVYNTCPWVNSKKNPNEPWTCGGWGRCHRDGPSPACHCADDVFTGPRCEFNRTDPKDVAWSECSLQCSNDGICLKGASKPVAEIFIPFVEGTKKSGLFDYQTPDFEYCYCPDGFFGVQCDMQYDICGNKDHICFHGSKCKNNGGEWGCDCSGTESAGLYCQYKATDDCGDNDAETFCTNDSTCTNGVCACKEGWEGTKCETEIKLAAPAGGGDNTWSSATVTETFVSMLSLAMLSLALIVG